MEVLLRTQLSETKQLYLPLFGFSQSEQNLYIWKQQPPQHEVGTITIPYPFDSADETLGWSVLPNMDVQHTKLDLWNVKITTNSNGMRGEEVSVNELTDDNLSIGVFGASQTFGESVNDKEEYVSILDERLPNSSVLNFGVRGYGTDQMLLKYMQTLKSYHFDVVILAFAFHHIPRNVNSFTFHAKPYFEYIDNSLILNGAPVPNAFHLYDKPVPEIDNSIFNKSLVLRYLLKFYRQHEIDSAYHEFSDAWIMTTKIIEEFSMIAEQQKSRFILVNIEEKFEDLELYLDQLAETNEY